MYDGKLRLRNSFGKNKIKWPRNEKLYLVIYELNEKNEIIAGKVETHLFNETTNVIETSVEELTAKELNEKLKAMKIGS